MNCKEFAYPNHRGRNRNFRGRGARAVNIQRPLVAQTLPVSTRKSTNTNVESSLSSIKWKNQSSSNNLTSTVTKSNSSKTFNTTDVDSKIVIAISAGRGETSYEVGIAAVDVCKPTLILCQISDMPSYINTLTKINILDPDEILIPLSFVSTSNSNRLVNKIKEHFKNVTITAVPRSTYNKFGGMEFVKELCAPQWDSIVFALQHKYYCLTAAAALLTYAESCLYIIYNKKSLKVEYQESEGYCIIDVSTADKLELVACNTLTNEKYSSLYGILNYCCTRIGARTLRATILQPPCSIPDIEARFDCITELKKNSHMMMSVQTILPKISNVDQLLSLASLPSEQGGNFSQRHLTYVLTLNALLDLIEPLREVFEDSKQPFFKDIKATLDNDTFRQLSHAVRTLIQPDARPANGQQGVIEKCFLIKPGVNGLLDVLRKTYSERVEDLREYVNQLKDKYNLPLTLGNNNKKGYHITMQLNSYTKQSFKKSELPKEFIQVERLYTSVSMKTVELMNLAIRIEDILLEVLKMSSAMVYQILIRVRNNIGLFYKLCEDIAKLDMIQSLAQASNGIGYNRPVFGDYLEITNSRHPLLDYLCSTEPISNCIFASPNHNVHIITGPNGSGKSIFIRQVLLLQVMAQVGCFIPAETATLRVCDRILARIHFDDNMDLGASTFVLEIKEVQYFQTVMTSNTLIIIDELCRSTAVADGTTLAMAILESLAKSKAFIFLATHYIFITKLEEFYPNITNWQMESIEEEKERIILHFTYSLVPGITTFKKYGLCAAVASWPKDVVEQAKLLYNEIELPKEHTTIQALDGLQRFKYNFEAELKMLKAKKQLTKVTFERKLLQYAENLKDGGLDLDNLNNVNSGNGQNITFESIYPEVIYSPSIVHPEDNPGSNQSIGYDQFYQDIQARTVQFPQYREEDAVLSSLISQNLNQIVEDNRKENEINLLTRNAGVLGDSNSIPWKSKSTNHTLSHIEEGQEVSIIGGSANVEDADVSTAIAGLNECSDCLTQDWEELIADDNKIKIPTPNVIIQSVHIFDENKKLTCIQQFDHDRGKLIEIDGFKTSENVKIEDDLGHSSIFQEQSKFSGPHNGSEQNLSIFLNAARDYDGNLSQNLSIGNEESVRMYNPTGDLSQQSDSFLRTNIYPIGNGDFFRFDHQNTGNSAKTKFESSQINSWLTPRDVENFKPDFQWAPNHIYHGHRSRLDSDVISYNDGRSISSNTSWFSIADNREGIGPVHPMEEFKGSNRSDNREEIGPVLPVEESKGSNRNEESFANAFFAIQAKRNAVRILEERSGNIKNINESDVINEVECNVSNSDFKMQIYTGGNNQNNSKGVKNESMISRGKSFDSSCSTLKLYPNLQNVSRSSTNIANIQQELHSPKDDSQKFKSKETDKIASNNLVDREELLNIPLYKSVNKYDTLKNKDNEECKPEIEIVQSLKRYFSGGIQNQNPLKTEECQKINNNLTNSDFSSNCDVIPSTSKSQSNNIFETSCGSESLFSSPEAFFSAADTTPIQTLVDKRPTAKKKFVPPLKQANKIEISSKTKIRKIKKPSSKTTFVPPKPLTKRQILEDFDKQRQRLLENTEDPDHIEKYMKFITNKPNVKQLQSQKYLAMIKKVDDEVVVIPASNPVVKRRTVVPLKRKLSSTEYDKTIFSDKNENKLKCLLKDKNKVFNFDELNPQVEDDSSGMVGVEEKSFLDFTESNFLNLFHSCND